MAKFDEDSCGVCGGPNTAGFECGPECDDEVTS